MTDTGGMFDNSYFDNSKSEKSDYVRQLEGLVFEKNILAVLERERDRERETERDRQRERDRERDTQRETHRERQRERQRERHTERDRERDIDLT